MMPGRIRWRPRGPARRRRRWPPGGEPGQDEPDYDVPGQGEPDDAVRFQGEPDDAVRCQSEPGQAAPSDGLRTGAGSEPGHAAWGHAPWAGGGSEDGQVAGVEGMVFGVLVFMLAVLVVASAWGVIDAKMAAAGAAREAVRAYVQAPSPDVATSMARQAAAAAIRAEGRDDQRMTLTMSGPLVRCGRVTAEVRYQVPLVSVPILGGAGRGLVASARQSALVDPYRSGLVGTASCG